ncbi:hypothetical protein BN1013_01083 [Candidatus Rubidus massiliensis]|nr:hypothetical protein BN1013_01083 [Candidatus Rubidus massiliensis]
MKKENKSKKVAVESQREEFYQMFLDELRDIYCAEEMIIENMPKMIEAASSKELKDAFKKHLSETKEQHKRLDQVFEELGEVAEGESCKGIEGILKECDSIIKSSNPSLVEDAELICAAQKIEHYEIASYGSLRTFARHLNLSDIEDILQEILDEEGKTNKDLTALAEGSWLSTGINAKAANE